MWGDVEENFGILLQHFISTFSLLQTVIFTYTLHSTGRVEVLL